MIFVVFLELDFFFEKQFLDPLSLCAIEGDFKHFLIVLDVLSQDETLHKSPRWSAAHPSALELDQCVIV